jgi:butyryl-CoA dehydrogenase
VLGGYGYTREYPVEQYYRDTRINPIHEGTNGIQALDLLGRKVMQENGEGFRLFVARVLADAERASANPDLQEFAEALRETCACAVEVTRFLGAALVRGEARQALANANHYMNLLGHLAIAWVWLAQSALALATARTEAEQRFARGTLDACRYFFRHELPQTRAWAGLLLAMDRSVLDAEIASL